MITLITIVHVIACVFLILVVLLQAGKGGGMGVAFGSGTSAAVFGGRGAGNFLERVTAGTAIVFMMTSMSLAYFASQSDSARLQKLTVDKKKKQELADQKAADEKAQKEAAERAKIAVPPATTPPAATPEATTPPPAGTAPIVVPAPKAEVSAPKAVDKPAAPKTGKPAPAPAP